MIFQGRATLKSHFSGVSKEPATIQHIAYVY